jgi:hypothetical protein
MLVPTLFIGIAQQYRSELKVGCAGKLVLIKIIS